MADPAEKFSSNIGSIAFGNVLAAAARDYKKEREAEEKKAQEQQNEDFDLDDLADDPELERLHKERLEAVKKEAEKRMSLEKKGHGEYREISEENFLPEVTSSQTVVCHFYHREFPRCRIMDKHLQILAAQHLEAKFVKVDAENCPFFVTKLGIKMLPCVILFRDGVSIDRIVGFDALGGKDDFTTHKLENYLISKGILKRRQEDDEEETEKRSIRNSFYTEY